MKRFVSLVALAAMVGCAEGSFPSAGLQNVSPEVIAPVLPDLSPSRGAGFAPPRRPTLDLTQTRPDFPPPPPPTARTVEEFDTTTAEDREAAVNAGPQAEDQLLGTTISSLGAPTDPGLWFKTPLVTSVQQGRIEWNGTSVTLELRPSGGAAGSGSQVSLAAMRLLGAPLTSLPEVAVFGAP